MKRSLVLVLLVAMGLGGCAGPKPYTLGKVFHEVPPPQADRAQVVFYQVPTEGINTVQDGGYFREVSEDDVVISGLKPQTYTVHDVTPGDHEYYIGKPLIPNPFDHVIVNLKAGKTYYMRYTYTHLVFGGFASFELVPEAVALEELETLRQLRFHKEIYAAQ